MTKTNNYSNSPNSDSLFLESCYMFHSCGRGERHYRFTIERPPYRYDWSVLSGVGIVQYHGVCDSEAAPCVCPAKRTIFRKIEENVVESVLRLLSHCSELYCLLDSTFCSRCYTADVRRRS